ncbi:hypothetical protein B296_00019621 [Ensete ventricosum]|uniref:Uncharacterized protein n=1 Tax=Ensete ventricosum TaxID=4639 RepID=A0A426ZTM1_ENSVE|nr:hypothetical protein B296_00019621 [Ensete ventricosum]
MQVPTRSNGRLRAQCPWAGLRIRWLHEEVPLAHRGYYPRVAASVVAEAVASGTQHRHMGGNGGDRRMRVEGEG